MNKKNITEGIIKGSFSTFISLVCFGVAMIITSIFLDEKEIKVFVEILNSFSWIYLLLVWLFLCLYNTYHSCNSDKEKS